MESHASNLPRRADQQHAPDRGIPVDAWNLCSKMFVEGRRMRALIGELRALDATGLNPGARHAIEQYLRGLAAAAALGDVAADAIVAPRTDDDGPLQLRPLA